MRTLRFVFDLFPDTQSRGLTGDDLLNSRSRFGVNRLTPLPRQSVWKKFIEKFDEPIIKILLSASLLKITVDVFEASPIAGGVSLGIACLCFLGVYLLKLQQWVPSLLFLLASVMFVLTLSLGHPSFEGLAVMIAVALATGVSFLSEYRSDREFEKLNEQKEAIQVRALRNGEVISLSIEDVVVGDHLLLETGNEIPADGRVLKAVDLKIDQSLMTGESEEVSKQQRPEEEEAEGPDQIGCLYRGTQVVHGLGEMIVTNVGDDTMLGQIARRLTGDSSEDVDTRSTEGAEHRISRKLTISKEMTPLQQKLDSLAKLISKVGYFAAIAIFVVLLIRGAFFVQPAEIFWPRNLEDILALARNLLGYFVYMVIIIVVAVPEGLPMSVTVSLALAMRKMTRANSLVRQLVACETIGSATVICTDKTGTLTQNQMRVVRIGVSGIVIDRSTKAFVDLKPHGPNRIDHFGNSLDWIGLNSAVNSTASLEEKDGKLVGVGSSTEAALLFWLRESGEDYLRYRASIPMIHRTAFSSEHKKMSSIVQVDERIIYLVKGAPEVILARCSKTLDPDGSIREFSDSDREVIREQLKSASSDQMRTLAFAHYLLPAEFRDDPEFFSSVKDELEMNLVFDGFFAIRDPLRPEVSEAVRKCREAGIAVKMITGDNLETANAIATEVGLLDSPMNISMTSETFNQLSDEELLKQLPHLHVLARAKPLDKYRMVKLLQEQNHVVAMTGDGTNDAPSLRKADVGLAMGTAGTEVAKEASKIVLLDDSFNTIVNAVHWGRALYENIQRFIQFQLTINVSALAIALLGPFLGFKPPFTVLQLLWINVIMDTFAAIALCSEPPRSGLMRMQPKRRDESILTRAMLGNIFLTATFFVIVMLSLLWLMAGTPDHPGLFGSSDEATTWLVRAGVDEEMVRATELEHDQNGRWYQRQAEGERKPVQVEFTVYQATLFFTVYVFFQVWNQINCRSLTPDRSGLRKLWKNPYFLGIASLTVLGQWLIVTYGGRVFSVEPLPLRDWLLIGAVTSVVLVFVEVSRKIRNLF